jgi:renalase
VAVLGAGMAGARAARSLAAAGLSVRVFDKGRGVGGRMARRVVGDTSFDHGAQFMRARGAAFTGQLADWERRGIAAGWGGDGRRVGVPGMTAPVRDLLDGVPVARATTIVRIARRDSSWHATDDADVVHGPFDAVAVTFPAPQILALLEHSGYALPGLERAAYAPCWSLMLAVDATPAAPLTESGTGPIGLLAADSSKPGRPAGHRLTVHATPDWSRQHLEASSETVVAALTRATEACLGRVLAPTYAAAHRWRFAAVETALGVPCLYDRGLRLGAAGDWCLGARIEAAYDSGLALADAVLADLSAAA